MVARCTCDDTSFIYHNKLFMVIRHVTNSNMRYYDGRQKLLARIDALYAARGAGAAGGYFVHPALQCRLPAAEIRTENYLTNCCALQITHLT